MKKNVVWKLIFGRAHKTSPIVTIFLQARCSAVPRACLYTWNEPNCGPSRKPAEKASLGTVAASPLLHYKRLVLPLQGSSIFPAWDQTTVANSSWVLYHPSMTSLVQRSLKVTLAPLSLTVRPPRHYLHSLHAEHQ